MIKNICKSGFAILTLCSVLLGSGCKYNGESNVVDPGALVDIEKDSKSESSVSSVSEETKSPVTNDSSDSINSTDSSDLSESSEASESSDLPESTGSSDSVTSSDIPETPVITEPNEPVYINKTLSDETIKITSRSLFVGDSICRGFEAYNVINSDNVFAKGNTATWNFSDFSMLRNGKRIDFYSYLSSFQPDYVFFWMGMNDMNMCSKDSYCSNYKVIIDKALNKSKAEVYVCAITPILAGNTFTTNDRINSFNSAMKEFISKEYKDRVHFVNFADALKNSSGNMNPQFNGGDGIHLGPDAYYVALEVITEQIKKEQKKTNQSTSGQSTSVQPAAEQSENKQPAADENENNSAQTEHTSSVKE